MRVFRDGTVEIVVPAGAAAHQVAIFVERHRDWIERHRRRAPRVDAAFPPQQIELRAGGEFWQCCTAATGAVAHSPRGAPLLRVRPAGAAGGVLELRSGVETGLMCAALLAWLNSRAEAILAPQLRTLAAELGIRYQRLQIRRQRTRWGSCSARGTISLNSCLLFHRPAVVRYLLAHELAHLTHLNHSRQFWELVQRYEPHWQALDGELTRGWSQVPGWVLRALRA